MSEHALPTSHLPELTPSSSCSDGPLPSPVRPLSEGAGTEPLEAEAAETAWRECHYQGASERGLGAGVKTTVR